jgi:hypothetical protein
MNSMDLGAKNTSDQQTERDANRPRGGAATVFRNLLVAAAGRSRDVGRLALP